MSCRLHKIVFRILLILLPGIAFAATDEETSSEFLYCAAIYNTGKQISTEAPAIKNAGREYTRNLLGALAFGSNDYVRAQYISAKEKHATFLRAEDAAGNKDFTQHLVALINSCKQTQETYKTTIDSYIRPKEREQSDPFVAKEATTSALDTLIALGKPDHEDYNADGRFVYGYPTAIGIDMYLFDRSNNLIRVVKYCNSNKAKCP
jgi:hypothetical protein